MERSDGQQKDPVRGVSAEMLSGQRFPSSGTCSKGDMSLVGPRPEVPYYVEQFREEVPLYMVKHQVRPGITGWAQSTVCGGIPP